MLHLVIESLRSSRKNADLRADENHLPDLYLLENHRRCLHAQAIQGEPNRAADGAKNTCEFYEHAELGLNAESVPDALAGYWTRVLARVKERSEAVRAKGTPEE